MKFPTFRQLCAASAFVVMGLAAASCNKDDDDDDDNANINQQDRDFVMMASYSNNAEVDAGSMASTKGANGAVRSFGSMMVTDHTAAQTELSNIARQLGQTPPTGLDAEHQALKTYLSGLTGHAFDSAYMSSQVVDHQKTITIMQTEINNGSNQMLKTFATQKLPVIQHHLHMADSILNSL